MPETKTCPKCGAGLPDNAPSGICPKCLMQAGLESDPSVAANPQMNPTTLPSGFVPPDPQNLAKHFPQLEILELLGKGGMGAVYKARQPALDRLVAVKILPPEFGADPAFAERFTREARALAKLSHQNIVSVFDFGRADGQFYFIMEYVDGTNLRQLIETGGLKPEEALAIVPQICEALQFAHNEGIVHRDIKPENVLVDKQGRVKIADFGLAKLLGKPPAEATLTGTHQVMGTLHYMAPEQMRGAHAVDHRADIYSLGVVFYEMLTGQLPIGKFEPPSKKVHIDVRLDEVVLRSLASEPDRRYQHARELKTDVEDIGIRELRQMAPGMPIEAEAAMRLVANPAIGLFVTGIAYWITIPMAFFILLSKQDVGEERLLWYNFAVIPALAGAIMMFGGLTMKRLESYKMCVVAGVLPLGVLLVKIFDLSQGRVAIGPGDIVGAPVGLWALVVLSRREVRNAFAFGRPPRVATLPDANAGRSTTQGPSDALFVVGSLALLMAVGTTLWLWLAWGASHPQTHQQSMTITALKGLSVVYAVSATFIIAASVLMRRLRARMFVLFSVTIVGIAVPAIGALNVIMEIEHIPEWPVGIPMWLGVPVAIWAAMVLFRQDVRSAFQAASQLRAEARNSAGSLDSKPRFSRKAILGFCWAPFFFVLLASMTIATRPRTSVPLSENSVTSASHGRVGEPDAVPPTEAINTPTAAPPSHPAGSTWWQWVMLATILPLGLTAPVGTTLLGVLALNGIRHSQGRVTGLPLALTDSLLYPLLLLDVLIVCLFWFLCVVGYEVLGPGTPMSGRVLALCTGITALASIVTCAYFDFLIVRAAWRSVCRQPSV